MLHRFLDYRNEMLTLIADHPEYDRCGPVELDLPAARGRNVHDGGVIRTRGSRTGQSERLLKGLMGWGHLDSGDRLRSRGIGRVHTPEDFCTPAAIRITPFRMEVCCCHMPYPGATRRQA